MLLVLCQARESKWLPEVDLDIEICLRTNKMGAFPTAWLYFTASIHPYLQFLQGRGCWPQILRRNLGPSLLHGCSPVSGITSQWFWCIPWLPSYPQLSNLQDLSHFKDFFSSQKLYLFRFGSPSFVSRPLPPGTPDKPPPLSPGVYSQTPQFQGANSKLLLETFKIWIWSLTFTNTLNYLVLLVFMT